MHPFHRRLSVSAVAAAWCVSAALGQSRVTIELSDSEVHVNESVVLQVSIVNFSDAGEVILPDLPGVRVRSLGAPSEVSQTTIINRQRSSIRTRTHAFELVPTAAGRITIPPVEVQVDGRALRSSAATLNVIPAPPDEPLKVKIIGAPQRVYVGQRIRLTLQIWLQPARATRSKLSPEQMWQCVYKRDDLFGPFPIPRQYSTESVPSEGGGSVEYYVFESSVEYDVTRPGPLSIDGVLIAVDYPARFGRDAFGREEITRVRRLRVAPQIDPVQALPLPAEGRPHGFNGAVGRFQIEASVAQSSVRVGDPLELRLAIRGEGALDALPPPVLHQQESLTADFRVPVEQLAGRVTNGQREFTQVVRARRADVQQVPPIEFAYFDPLHGAYRVARSQPIALTVRPAETLSGIDVAGAQAPPPAPRDEPLDGLRDIRTDSRRLLRRAAQLSVSQIALVTLGPAAAFGATACVVVVRQARERDAAGRRRRSALREGLAALSQEHQDGARVAQEALRAYVAARFDVPAGRVVGQDVVSLLQQRGVDPELVASAQQMLHRCEAAVYGGEIASADVRREAALLIERLELTKL